MVSYDELSRARKDFAKTAPTVPAAHAIGATVVTTDART